MENETIVCQKCGEKNPIDNRFCKNCAAPLQEVVKQPEQAQQPIAPQNPTQFVPPFQQQEPQKKKKGKGCLIAALIAVALVVVVIIVIIASGGDSDQKTTDANGNTITTTQEVKVPLVVTVDQLINALNENALKASNTYKGKYVELTGKLSVIDSSGDYFSLAPQNDDFSLDSVLCYIDDEHLDQVSNFVEGQSVTVIGTITDVGEVMGYSLEVESIK